MIVVQLLGGLGNQMFQYACGRALALRTGKKLILDTSRCTDLRPYALHHFTIQAQTVQSIEELTLIAQDLGIASIVVKSETGFHFDPQIVSIQDSVMLANGFWQSEKYFSDMVGHIHQDFTPSVGSISEEGLGITQKMRENTSIALHIRRGDYTASGNAEKHGVLPLTYYKRAMEYFDVTYQDAQYYVFSDDIEWCKRAFGNQPNVSIVEHHAQIEVHEDLWLMSQCKHNIIANSTYSWWGAWLGEHPDQKVIAPERWFADAPFDTKDLVPEEWVKMPLDSAINIKHKIAILYICTGKYHVFWEDFYKSAEKNLLTDHEKTYFVFTDYQELPFSDQSNVQVIAQEKLGWPDDTLMRFHMFRKIEYELEKFDYILFFNANLLIVAPVGEEILPNNGEDGLCALWHPCFYNEIDNQKYTYERNQNSLAYVPMGDGTRYYAGGLNGGTRAAYLQLIHQLADNIERDKENNIVALWHDESHLNKYLLHRSVRVLSPLYGWPEEFPPNHQVKIMIKDKRKYGGHQALRNGS